MRRGLVAVVAAPALAGPARAAVPIPDARALVVENATTGEVRASRNGHERAPIASITKPMTVLVALKHLRVDQVVTVAPQAVAAGCSRIPLRPDEQVLVGDLLKGALIQSAIERLPAWGVARYRTLELVRRVPYASVALPYGRAALRLLAARPLVRVARVVERVVAATPARLPVERGQRLGRVEVWAGGRLLGARPLLAARSVPRLGGRLRWYATRTVHHFLRLFG